jgi:hypothetical protein
MITEAVARRPRPRVRTRAVRDVPLAAAVHPTEEQIRQRAYEIYAARAGAGQTGSPEWDWQQAELELRARMALLGRP